MLNIAISVTFKLIILIMLIYILAYIVDLIYLEVYLYPKLLEEQEKKEKLLEDENIEIIDITVDDDLTKALNDIIKKTKEMKDDEWICFNWKPWNGCRDLYGN